MFDNVGEWNNDMAKGMMSIPQEMEAFGEKMPETGTACQSHEDSDDNGTSLFFIPSSQLSTITNVQI